MLDIQNYIQKLGDDSLSSEEQALALQEIEKSLVQSQLKHEEVVQSSTDLVVEAVKSIEDTVYTKFKELSTSESMKGPKGNNGRDGKDGKDGKDGVGYNGKDGKDGVDGIDGEDGRYVTDVEIDFDDTLLVTLSDNTTIKTTKEIKGPKGDMGPQGLRGSNGIPGWVCCKTLIIGELIQTENCAHQPEVLVIADSNDDRLVTR